IRMQIRFKIRDGFQFRESAHGSLDKGISQPDIDNPDQDEWHACAEERLGPEPETQCPGHETQTAGHKDQQACAALRSAEIRYLVSAGLVFSRIQIKFRIFCCRRVRCGTLVMIISKSFRKETIYLPNC